MNSVQPVEIRGLERVNFTDLSSYFGGHAHLISYTLDPFDHFRDGILIHAPSRFANGIDNGKVTL